MATTEGIAAAFALLRLAYPDYVEKHLSAAGALTEMMDFYIRFFPDVPDDVLIAAAQAHITVSAFWPRINELREQATQIAMNRLSLPSAFDAWNEVKRALKEAKPSQHAWSHPFVKQAIGGIGGLVAFGQSAMDEEMTWRAHFFRAYESYVNRAQAQVQTLPQVRALAERLSLERRLKAGNKPTQLPEGEVA